MDELKVATPQATHETRKVVDTQRLGMPPATDNVLQDHTLHILDKIHFHIPTHEQQIMLDLSK